MIGLLGCVAASYTGEILIYHAVMRLNKAGSVRKWDLYLHQRIPLATHVKEMVVVDENRIEGSIDYCRALLVSGDTGNFVLSFAQAVTSQETNKGNEHTNFHLIYDNDDSNGHDDRESFSVPVKDSLNTIPQFAAVPFLRDPANLNDKSDTERGTLKADSRRLAKRWLCLP